MACDPTLAVAIGVTVTTMQSDIAVNDRLTDHLHDYTIDSEGDIIVERTGVKYDPVDGAAMRTTFNVNMTTLFRVPPRETNNVDILVVEAELAEGREPQNPAHPKTEAVEREARQIIEQNGHQPAWEYHD